MDAEQEPPGMGSRRVWQRTPETGAEKWQLLLLENNHKVNYLYIKIDTKY
jgi:hypothetical protein